MNSEEIIKRKTVELDEIINGLFGYEELKRFVSYQLNTDPEDISIPQDKPEFIYDMLTYFGRRDLLKYVVIGLRKWRPNNRKLYSFSIDVGLASRVVTPEISGFNLEAIVNEETGISDLREWQLALGKIENQVCLIKSKKNENSKSTPKGTGFLIGDDLVLTNWHVVNHFIDKDGNPKSIQSDSISVHFGFFAKLDTNQKEDGITYLLDRPSWLIAHSPQEELDYALLRLEKKAAKEAAGGVNNRPPNRDDAKRGHIAISAPVSIRENMPLFIIQHPDGDPMGIAVDLVSKLDNMNNRIQYFTNTREGSSGSPCFDARWNLVALHHAGCEGLTGKFNEGIPIDKIFASLKDKKIDLSQN